MNTEWPKMNDHIIHLLSGGLDSVTMLYDLHGQGHPIHCVLVDYKQPHVQELTFAISHCIRLNVLWTRLEIPALGGLKDGEWIVPNRLWKRISRIGWSCRRGRRMLRLDNRFYHAFITCVTIAQQALLVLQSSMGPHPAIVTLGHELFSRKGVYVW